MNTNLIRSIAVVVLFCNLKCAFAAPESSPAPAADSERQTPILLESHEANRVAYTKDSDDVGFMDFTLSLQYPLFFDKLSAADSTFLPFVAFTGRFGQYIGTRDSSPVIGKRYNPKVFVRYFLGDAIVSNKDEPKIDYVDIEYAHESNGQSIGTLASFNTYASDLGNENYARDYISRGWDYFGLAARWHPASVADGRLEVSANIKKYFGGLLQKTVEEYNDWEGQRSIRHRADVSGLRIAMRYDFTPAIVNNIAFAYETGTNHPARYSTAYLEAELSAVKPILGIPLVVSYRSGYNGDLAQYYVKSTTWSIGFKFETIRGLSANMTRAPLR